jgi:hypothetical protein
MKSKQTNKQTKEKPFPMISAAPQISFKKLCLPFFVGHA